MKNFIKKILNFNNNSRPYSFFLTKLQKIDSDISDLFTYILGDYETIFIAENNLALLKGFPIDCTHIFHFFDKNGIFIRTFEANSQLFHFKLLINEKVISDSKFGSFTHHVKYSNIVIKKYEELLTNISFQHRGYTGYRKDINSGFSYVHGNFGGMYISKNNTIKSLARRRVKHTYTPQLIIKPSHRYEFIFVNPTSKNSNIKFLLIEQGDVKVLKEVCLASYASFKFTLDDFEIGHECNISWETSLPIFRCIVFDHADSLFDVFHS
jgi:hypothetical protein